MVHHAMLCLGGAPVTGLQSRQYPGFRHHSKSFERSPKKGGGRKKCKLRLLPSVWSGLTVLLGDGSIGNVP